MSEEVIFRIIEGNLTGEEFVFEEKGLCLIGRSADCALQIPKEKDMRISRRHCLLILDPPHVRVRDLGSRNGTTVNDELLDSGSVSDNPEKMTPVDRILKDGDILSIGETVLELDVPSEKLPVVPASKASLAHQTPPTKVIKLTKPSPTKTGTLIPKSTPVGSGFFAPPSSNANTTSRTIAMTEAISREELAKLQHPAPSSSSVPPPAAAEKPAIKKATIVPREKHAVSAAGPLAPPKPAMAKTAAGPLAPPPPQMQKKSADGGQTMVAPSAAGPLAPPQEKNPILLGKLVGKRKDIPQASPVDEAPEKVVAAVDAPMPARTKVLEIKKKSVASPAAPPMPPQPEVVTPPADEKPPKVLKAKLINPDSTGARKIPKKLGSHMKTVVMDAAEFEDIPDFVPQPEGEPVKVKKKKRVTKFKIKGPN